jgi:flavin-binding protein dodecin
MARGLPPTVAEQAGATARWRGGHAGVRCPAHHPQEHAMANHVYKILELVGSSPTGTDDAIRNAIETAAKTIRHIDWFEVVQTRGHVADGKVAHFQVNLKVGFRLEG